MIMSKVLDEITKIVTDDGVVSEEYKAISIRMTLEEFHYVDMDFFIVMNNQDNDHKIPIVFEEDEFNKMIQGLPYTVWLYRRSDFGQRVDVDK